VPLYEYDCPAHGVFELHRAVREFASPASCPACHELSPRILSVPGVSLVERGDRVARDRNERSQHEPRVAQRAPAPASDSGARAWQAAPSGGLPWAIGHQ
jgi:putative FmdB family regulatory protein